MPHQVMPSPILAREPQREIQHIELTPSKSPSISGGGSSGSSGKDTREISFGDNGDLSDDERYGSGDSTLSSSFSSSSASASASGGSEEEGPKTQSPPNRHRFARYATAFLMRSPRNPPPASGRQQFGLLLGIAPAVVFPLALSGLEVSTLFDFVAIVAAACGAFGVHLYVGDSGANRFAKMAGGAVATVGAMFTNYVLLHSIHSIIVVPFMMFGSVLGAMPGLMAYILIKILADEIYGDPEAYENEISRLTQPLAAGYQNVDDQDFCRVQEREPLNQVRLSFV